MELVKKHKFLSLLCVVCLLIMSLVTCFAGSGEQAFVDALTDPDTGISADSMWGAVTPVVKIIVFVFLFAFAYKIIRRVLKKGSGGKFGM